MFAVLREFFVRFVIFVVKSEIGKHRILLSTTKHTKLTKDAQRRSNVI